MDLISTEDFFWALNLLTEPGVLALLVIGVIAGLIFGAAPGVTVIAGLAVLTPITFDMSFGHAMALLLGAYTAGYFAGSIPAILINTPGTSANAATSIEGYMLAKKGRADEAVSLAVICSFIGGIFSVIVLATLAPNLAKVALKFTSVEYFSLALLGIFAVAAVAGESLVKGVAAALIGIIASTVGIDPVLGGQRLTFGTIDLLGGVPLIPALLGLFSITELLSKAQEVYTSETMLPPQKEFRLREVIPVFLRNKWLILKSAVIGTFIGILPSLGPNIAAWVSFGEAARTAKKGDHFGEGEEKGVIAAETANNAVTGGGMVPLLTVGIPGDPVTAVLIGALIIQGIDPGPFFIRDDGNKFMFMILAMGFANILMLLFGLSARGLLRWVVRIPNHTLIPVVAVLSAAGGFAVNGTAFEVSSIIVIGVVGFLMMRFGFPMAPIVLGLVLGPLLEENLRNGLTANDLDFTVFITRPISGGLIVVTVLLVLFLVFKGPTAKLRG
ncbi:MAG: tripartite tricarboxylate transporter permease [Rhodospirillales bacterium]|nr:tripartite tricarboxylate transporter permease [Rhodospirillales bacterium]